MKNRFSFRFRFVGYLPKAYFIYGNLIKNYIRSEENLLVVLFLFFFFPSSEGILKTRKEALLLFLCLLFTIRVTSWIVHLALALGVDLGLHGWVVVHLVSGLVVLLPGVALGVGRLVVVVLVAAGLLLLLLLLLVSSVVLVLPLLLGVLDDPEGEDAHHEVEELVAA